MLAVIFIVDGDGGVSHFQRGGEREQGTLDQLLVSPLTTWQIFIGKAVPALIVATFQATIV
ncbi:hypothetical protein ACJ6VA_25120, partial [Escherichia coli]